MWKEWHNNELNACNIPLFAVFVGLSQEEFNKLVASCSTHAIFQQCLMRCRVTIAGDVPCFVPHRDRQIVTQEKLPGKACLLLPAGLIWVTRLGQSCLLLEDLPCAGLFGEQRLKDQRIAGNVGVYTVPKILLLSPPSTRVPATALTMCLHQFAVLMAKSMWEYCHFLEYFFISFRLDVK